MRARVGSRAPPGLVRTTALTLRHHLGAAEFDYAVRRKGVASLVPIVMEVGCRNTDEWTGAVGFRLGSQLYFDLSGDGAGMPADDQLDRLAEFLRARLPSDPLLSGRNSNRHSSPAGGDRRSSVHRGGSRGAGYSPRKIVARLVRRASSLRGTVLRLGPASGRAGVDDASAV